MRISIRMNDTVADAGKQVQRLGKKRYESEVHFYTDQMHDNEEWSIKIKNYLNTAIENDEFLVYLQPKYEVNKEMLHGAEALIRWNYRREAFLTPYRFVPIFEISGLISKLDDIVLHKVCGHLRDWSKQGLPLYPISVNLSRKSMGNPNLVEHLTGIVDQYGVPHKLIDFELTESAAYEDQARMIDILQELKSRGFKISMDDFGTGYSSLALLSVMPVDTLKIDKSFVDRIGTAAQDERSLNLVRHIISMAKDLGFTSLAEGAEEKIQVDILRALGCQLIQGYYYSKPLPVDQYEALLVD